MGISSYTPHRLLLFFGFTLCVVLLPKFAWDFSKAYPLLAIPSWLLVGLALVVSAVNVFQRPETKIPYKTHESKLQAGLIAAIPLGFLAASLDCTGLAMRGCTAFCTFIKLFWIPLLAGVCLKYYYTQREVFLLAISGMSLVPIVPHCICANAVNAWWIDRLGASPECYAWGLTVSVLSVATLLRRVHLRLSLVLCYVIIGGALSFFVGHHYFHFPW